MTGLTIKFERNDAEVLFRIGMRHPSVLWRHLADQLRQVLIQFRVLSGAAKQVAEVHAEFENRATQGQFKERWFDGNIVSWTANFMRAFNRNESIRILEIGSWEGRSTLFLLTYFTEAHLTAVDTWAGSDEHQGTAATELRTLEDRFDQNLASCATRLTKRKGSSRHVLPQLLDEDQKFDLIYVDGSHFADDVLTDGIIAWRLLQPSGLMIFDDLTWNYYPRKRDNPAWAIDLFLRFHAGQYRILSVTTCQLTMQKK
ncbi:class I SAM-dependent methyltransferase [Mycobacterium intracellulare]|uniref:class I SAM-dependent methyltransferase n=1 Tax=Mycobacterium intracellulare TaxID=1767 RepID=UPI000B8CD510|nr:class I SAM-dependent methyltransferase [Mycobacterium intracellulare]ASQ87045.1 hypothetical protein CE197_16690 [Mycobacterium intracellulare subsp. chimaera]MCF1812587.1 class I SAM-dependent methyltransferase [Mycobacterium intracellulare subsp. intracellulare]MDS0336295.1 class I SAM-dependent methyltransferase [Mycobacterium intracellulare]